MKYSYISNQRELPSMSKISSFSILPPILWLSELPTSAGVTLRSPLPMVCQPFRLAFFSRASYKEYDSPCSSD